jgi:hypothetical protein
MQHRCKTTTVVLSVLIGIYPITLVYHPQKPDKIRVVFDCSARYRGTSLNDQLLQGPDLTNSLAGVLTRFREEPVAFMSDVESMFTKSVSDLATATRYDSCGGQMAISIVRQKNSR